jgi:CheY-like chemotaxis protein
MPIVDGMTATKMIRSFEKTRSPDQLSMRATLNRRIPIFAVSATLVEDNRQTYMDAGFDGWILKPVDFKRTAVLLEGIVDPAKRRECLYQPGEWERGGWFEMTPDPTRSHTKPDPREAASTMASGSSTAGEAPADPISREQQRLRDEPAADPPRPATG